MTFKILIIVPAQLLPLQSEQTGTACNAPTVQQPQISENRLERVIKGIGNTPRFAPHLSTALNGAVGNTASKILNVEALAVRILQLLQKKEKTPMLDQIKRTVAASGSGQYKECL
ncbi:hypothetical protein C8J56DRAFT_889474 [Mycena floridula]|nr:hypothetical protein C8J56DRAFT_889474 [Mycena floridula]